MPPVCLQHQMAVWSPACVCGTEWLCGHQLVSAGTERLCGHRLMSVSTERLCGHRLVSAAPKGGITPVCSDIYMF